MKTPENHQLISIVVPAYNEAAGITDFHKSLLSIIKNDGKNSYEIIYVDDGSTDATNKIISKLISNSSRIKLLRLSRNFGKEVATTAGIHQATGNAIITIDADGQHPVEIIPKFISHWQAGAKVVIGIRSYNQKEGLVKKFGSKVFYSIFNRLGGIEIIPGSTDFRLIDQSVQQEFNRMTERNRITRGLIDWLGYQRNYIYFKANPRLAGEPTYSFKKLLKLAVDSVISHSTSPLYIAAYIGVVILPLSILLGLFMLINLLLGDPTKLHATGSAYITVLILFLVGILLVSQAIIGLYLSHIHTETQNRPLYIVDKDGSQLN